MTHDLERTWQRLKEAWEQKLKLFSIAEVPPAAELNTLRTFYDFLSLFSTD